MAIKYLSSLNLNNNELQFAAIHVLANAPTSPTPVIGQIYYNSGDSSLYVCTVGGATPTWAVVGTEGTATSSALGSIKLFNDTQQNVAATSVSATAARTYGVQLNSDNQAVVNVPWTDTNTTYGIATDTTPGLIELFNNTDQSAAANTVTTTAGRTYGIQLNSGNQAVVNVPWVNTTYSAATTIDRGLILLEDATVQDVAANTVTAIDERTYGLQVNSDGQGVINVPWIDTVYTHTTNANLTGDVTSNGNATTLTNAPVIAKVLTGYTSGAGTVAATDSILQAIQKLNGNDATNANLTGVVTSSGNATAIADAALSIAKTNGLQTALNAKVVSNTSITGATKTKITYDSKGLVTAGANLVAADIPSLDASKITTGTIDATLLPSYVDDVLEYANLAAFPATGETGKIYIAIDTSKTYRWSGSVYVYITSGAVDSVAGKTGVVTLVKGDVGLGSVDNTADSAKNVFTATKLATSRAINGVDFNGTAPITVTAAAGTLTGTSLNATITGSSLTSVGTLANLTVTAAIAGSVTGSSGSTTGNAATATNVAYSGLTGTVPTWNQNTTGSAATATSATKATNIAGGLGGSIPYQTAVNTTALLANGSAGQVLQSNGGTAAPTWVTRTKSYNLIHASGTAVSGSVASNENKTWTITHGMGASLLYMVQVIQISGTGAGETVFTDVTRTTTQVVVTFNTAPTSGEYTVVIVKI